LLFYAHIYEARNYFKIAVYPSINLLDLTVTISPSTNVPGLYIAIFLYFPLLMFVCIARRDIFLNQIPASPRKAVVATRGPGMITALLFLPTTAPSSYAPTERPALGMRTSAAEARTLMLDCTVCVCRVSAAANSKNI